MATLINAKQHSQNEISEEQQKEMTFIYNHFMNFIKMNDKTRGEYYHPKYKTHIFYLVLEFTKGLFSLSELFWIFISVGMEGALWQFKELGELKANILKNSSEGEDFKRKIDEINPVILSVLVDLICFSEIFYEDEDGVQYPKVVNNAIAVDDWY